jgi:hypothetical protein
MSAKKGKRLSPGHERMAASGRKNLEQWKAEAPVRARELEANVAAFRAALLRDIGPNPSATKLALVEAVITTYSAILVVRTKLLHSRKSNAADMLERVSWLGSNQARLLKLLNLDAKTRPRTLSEVFERKGVAPAPTKADDPEPPEERDEEEPEETGGDAA